jgi:hypothetical protein
VTSLPPENPGSGAPARRAPPWARTIVRVMDEAIAIPGTNIRIGLDGILGLVAPGVADALLASSGVLLIVYGFVSGVPGAVLFRMAAFVALDALVGTIPLVGDLFDFGFKSNRKNVELIERYQRPGTKATAKDYAFVIVSVVTVVVVLALPVVLAITLLARLFGS